MFVQVTLYHVLASMHVTMSGSSIREILQGGGFMVLLSQVAVRSKAV